MRKNLFYNTINTFLKKENYDQLTMALIQRYTTELSTQARTTRQIHDDNQSVEQVLNNVAAIKRQDEDEKRYLNSLNNRLEELIRSLNNLEIANKKLRDDLNNLITSWGIDGENRARFLQELDDIIRRLTEQNRRKLILQVEGKIFDEQTEVTERVLAVFIDVFNLYRDKSQIIFDLTNELEDELHKIRLRLDISNAQVKSHDDDYQKELAKFRSYLAEWSKIALEKQYLLNEIQSLKEYINLRLAYNQEEINEWKRLLDQSKDDSILFYKEELTNAIRDIKRDYAKQAKKFQDELEYQIEGQLRMVENQLKQMPGLTDNSLQESEKNRLQIEETKLRTIMDEYEKEQIRLNELTKILSDKRRLLRDEEGKLHEIERKIRDKQFNERTIADRLKHEYEDLRTRFEQMAFELRFSIEDELRIYARLLDELMKKSSINTTQSNENNNFISTTIRSSGIIDDYQNLRSSSSTGDSTRIFDLNDNTENLFRTTENEIQETFDGHSIIRSSSFSTLN